MTGSISPEQLQRLLAGYVLYGLSPDESASLEELLTDNPDLWRDIDQLQQTLEQTYNGAPVSPPAALREAVMRAAIAPVALPQNQNVVSGSFSPATSRLSGLRSRPWGRLVVAAAAALIAGLSLSNILLWRTLQLERANQPDPEPLIIVLGSPDDPAPGQAEVVINPAALAGSLTVENLPPLEPGSVYVLWTVVDPRARVTVDDKNAILTTVFTVDGQGQVSQPIDLPAVYRRNPDLVRAIAITKERADAPQAHLSKPILIQRL